MAYEGVEKVIHWIFHPSEHEHTADGHIEDTQDAEKAKIKSAVKTDFILSVEIVIIALGSVLEKSLTTQILTVSVVALIATVGVYGFVALIVRMDDVGYALLKRSDGKGILANIGNILVNLLPVIIRLLSIVGTIALILVAGGIFEHNIDFLHHLFPSIPTIIKEIVFGITGGLIVILAATVIKKIIAQFKKTKKVEVPENAESEE